MTATIEETEDTLEEFIKIAKTDRSWVKYAACRGMPVDLFFPDEKDAESRKKALLICNGNQRTVMNRKTRRLELVGNPPCPVREHCQQYIMSLPPKADVTGIFAGLSHRARKTMRSRRSSSKTE